MANTNPKLIIARAQHVLVTPRKVNLLLEAIIGRRASLVLKQLTLTPQRAADPVAKLIKQAIGNAVSLHSVSPDSLIIDSAFATKGRTLKRAHIGGRGRTKPYQRIASHLTLNLRVQASSPVVAPSKSAAPKAEKIEAIKKAPVKTKAVKTTKKNK